MLAQAGRRQHVTVLQGDGAVMGAHGGDALPTGCPFAAADAAAGRPWHAACVDSAPPEWQAAANALRAAVDAVLEGRSDEAQLDLTSPVTGGLTASLSARVTSLGTGPGAGATNVLESCDADRATDAVLDAMEEGVLYWGPDGRILAANLGAERILGVPRETLVGVDPSDPRIEAYDTDGTVIPIEARAGAVARRTGLPSTRRVMGIRYPGGRMRWISVNSRPMFSAGRATPDGVVSTFADITGQRRGEERYRALVDRSPNVVALVDGDGRITFVNRAVERVFGRTPADAIGRSALELVHPDDRAEAQTAFRDALASGGRPLRFECRLEAADGSWPIVEVQATAIVEPDGSIGLQLSSRDITDRRRAEREVRSLSARLAALVDGVPLGIVLEDEDRRMAMVNGGLCELFGTEAPPSAMIGQDAVAGIGAAARLLADPEEFLADVDDLVARGEPRFDDELLFADGRICLRDYVPIRDADGHLGHVWLFRDVTAERRAQRDLRSARDEALAATRAKSEFVATVSHELRTPLNGIVGALELLAEMPLAGEQEELATIARDAGTGLRAVVEDILDFSRIEASKLPVRARQFGVGQLLRGVRDVLTPAVAERTLDLRVAVDDDVPDLLVGDADRLRQILLNLAGNAVKFTPDGSVTIAARAGARSGDAVELVLEVRDTGPGIPREEHERLFEPFTQLDASATRSHGGTGLGLAITSRLVALLGGDIVLVSEPGAGATFRVTVPLGLPAAPVSAAEAAPPGGTLRGRILLADDNDVNRRVIARQLERLGLAVTAVPGGREAIDAAATTTFDAILMDCRMPGVDGYSAARAIRADEPGGRRTPMLAITADARPEDLERCRAAGMDDVVTKPVTLADLRDRLATAMGSLDVAVLDTLRDELADDALLRTVVRRYLDELGPRRARIRAAHDAGDGAALADGAHALASPSATLGFTRLGELCGDLERAVAGDGRDAAYARVDVEIGRAAAAAPQLLERVADEVRVHPRPSSRVSAAPSI